MAVTARGEVTQTSSKCSNSTQSNVGGGWEDRNDSATENNLLIHRPPFKTAARRDSPVKSSGASSAFSKQRPWSVTHKLTGRPSNSHAASYVIYIRTSCVLPAFQDPRLKVQDGDDQETASKREREKYKELATKHST